MVEEKVQIRFRDAPGSTPTAEQLGIESFKLEWFEEGVRGKSVAIDVSPAEYLLPIAIAVIAMGSGVLAAAITGVCAIYSSRNNAKIVIKGSNGQSVEVPAGTSDEDLKKYITLARSMDADEIEIIDITPRPYQPALKSNTGSPDDDVWYP